MISQTQQLLLIKFSQNLLCALISHETTVTIPLMYTILEHVYSDYTHPQLEKFSFDHASVQFHPSSWCVVCLTPINASLPIFLLHMHC